MDKLNKFVLVLIASSVFFLGSASASVAPDYTLDGGVSTSFNSANTFGHVPNGVEIVGIQVSFGYFGQILFGTPLAVTFNTLSNSILQSEGVLSVTNNYPGSLFSDLDTNFTSSPISSLSMVFRDNNLPGEPGSAMIFELGKSSSPSVNDPIWSIIPTGDHTLLGIAQFDQSNPDLGYWAFEISTPVPEPETYAMLLVGLAMIGFTMRKKVITDPGGMVSV